MFLDSLFSEPMAAAYEDTKTKTEQCPNCKERIDLVQGYRAWCHACNWNAGIEDTPVENSFIRRLSINLNRRHGWMLLEHMKTAKPDDILVRKVGSRRITVAVIGLYSALLVGTVALGIILILCAWPSPLLVVIGAALLAVPLAVRPRWPKPPKTPIQRADFPNLFSLVDEVADELRAPRAQYVVIDEAMNASVYQAGREQKPVLTLGMPLWALLQPQERVALLAHEFAHLVNGDPARSRWMIAANNMLDAWIDMFDLPANDTYGLVAKGIVWPLSLPFRGLRLLLFKLTYIESQIAEYRADYLAAAVAGTPSISSLLKAFRFIPAHLPFLQRTSGPINGAGLSLMGQFRDYVDALPYNENLRLERCELNGDTSIDMSHPPTQFRLEFLNAFSAITPSIIMDSDQSAQIDAELRRLELKLSERLYERAFPRTA
jgi:Zn-dependent protease with chaperone function